ncbi:MAG TPA: PorV/PorQ family protein [Melioribacteraceae bacterium]|nr:PorV/PorQ family protein [Melioribacteraceae bacterium]
MKIIRKKILLVVLILLASNAGSFAFEKVGTTSFQFLKVWPGARATGMAEAFTSIASNSESVFWNPAGLARLTGFDFTFGFVDWFMDVNHFSFSAAKNFGELGTFGVFGVFSSVGEIEVTRVDRLGFVNGVYNPGLTGEVINPSSLVLGVSYARNVTDKFAFGLSVKYVHENLVFEKAGALVFDGGLTFNTGFRSIVIGASVRHFGQEVKFIDKSYPLPQTFNIGISSYLFSGSDPLIASAGDHSLLVSYDMIQPRDYDQMHSVGFEYGFKDLIYLRGGYVLNRDQEGFSAGVGIYYKGYRIDYSFNDYGDYLDSVHRFTIGYEIN